MSAGNSCEYAVPIWQIGERGEQAIVRVGLTVRHRQHAQEAPDLLDDEDQVGYEDQNEGSFEDALTG